MPRFVVHHRHAPDECAAAFAAWRGFHSPLRRHEATASCPYGGHELWWEVEAASEAEALALLPRYVAERALVVRVSSVPIP
jgi:hypothetical protein